MSTRTRPHVETVAFPVDGMTCASCVNRITRFLSNVDGVEAANVNLAAESATVRFDPARVTIDDLAAAVDAAGYVARTGQAASSDRAADISDAAERRTDRDEVTARHLAELRVRLAVAVILTVPLLAGLAQ